MHRDDRSYRILIMNALLKVTSSDTATSASSEPMDRYQRILDMTAAMRAMYGDAALAIADGQPGTFDVGGDSGIRWSDLADELRAPTLPPTVTIAPAL